MNLDLLRLDAATTLKLTSAGRITGENDPDNSAGPRLFFAGCEAGNVVHVHHDLDDEAATALTLLANTEPPWAHPLSLPVSLDTMRGFVPGQAVTEIGMIWRLPLGLKFPGDANIVTSHSPAGRALLEELVELGMPPHLVQAGFLGVGDFWDPWCAALVDDQIASLAFSARLGSKGAGIGVYTFPNYRGRGLAAATTAAWSNLPSLQNRALFYSTSNSNLSSQRVVARLGLPRVGMRLTIS